MIKKTFHCTLLLFFVQWALYAENDNNISIDNSVDSVRTYYLDEVVVTSSSKETNRLEKLPGSVSVLSPQRLQGMQIHSIKTISSVVPNFFIPDYGSKMTAPVYIRGIGNRSAGQAAGMYVDNAPYLNKSAFDFDFIDVQRIEVHRGPQGSLYGRNAMGGIIHVFTPSPLRYQGTKVGVTGGNYGLFKAKASHYLKINNSFGISAAGSYERNDGYFVNLFDGKKADQLETSGGRIRCDFKFSDFFTGSLVSNYDYVHQGAFPYGLYNKETRKTEPVNYNDKGSYDRNLWGNTLNLEYQNESLLFSSATSYQWLDDNMYMDQDFTVKPYFTLNQKQKQHTFTQEWALKSQNKSNYQWSVGVFGFSNQLVTDATVTIKEVGIQSLQQKVFDQMKIDNPKAPVITIKDSQVPIPGIYKTPGWGAAIFHQSTYNNLFVDGLSLTAGIRLDYEKDRLKYNSNSKMNLGVIPPMPPGRPEVPLPLDTILQGTESMHFTQILPKIAIRYELNQKNYTYFSLAKGYNPGGYNVQIFSKLSENALMSQAMEKGGQPVPEKTLTINDAKYLPEVSWNMEWGWKGKLFNDMLSFEASLFYTLIERMQLTRFIDSGEGRMLANVGKAENKGLEINLDARFLPELFVGLNYGYTHATFSNYNDSKINYSGKFLPYVPQQTLSLYAGYIKSYHKKWVDYVNFQVQYHCAGKIYWTEANDITQPFYGLLNLRAGVKKGICTLNIWTKNTLNTDYNAFYFESMGNSFFQRGKPFQIGVEMMVSF